MRAARKISRTVQNPYGIAGILLFSSFLNLLLALIILIASGALPGFSANLQRSLGKIAPFASTFRKLDLLWTVGWMAIGWNVLWLVGYLAGAGVPGLLFIMPAVIGAALLMKSREKSV